MKERTLLPSFPLILITALLAPQILPAALEPVEEIAWVCTPQNGCYARVLKTYTRDTVTGELEGNYEEWWLDGFASGDVPLFQRVEVNYKQGVKDGEEILHPSYQRPLTEHRIRWSMGEELGGSQVEYSENGVLWSEYEWTWSGDVKQASSKSYYDDMYGYYLASSYDSRYQYSGTRETALYSLSYEFWPNGNLKKENYYEKGIGWHNILWFENGKKQSEEHANAMGLRDGLLQAWNEDGFLISSWSYRDGLYDGWVKSFNYAGEPLIFTEYKMGKRHGGFEQHGYVGGRLTSVVTGSYSNDERCGIWTSEYYSVGSDPSVTVTDYGECTAFQADPEDLAFEEAEPEKKWLSGRVFDKVLETPLANVQVQASGGYTASTDAAGSFQMALGTEDIYQLSFNLTGYTERSGRLDMSNYQKRTISVPMMAIEDNTRPTVISVKSSMGDVFFENLVAEIPYTAEISWGEATPASVTFSLNGQDYPASVAGGQASLSLPVSPAMKVGLGAQTNTLSVTAVNAAGTESTPNSVHPVLVPLPSWLTAMGGLTASTSSTGLLNYKLSRQWPSEPLKLELNEQTLGSYAWQAWSLMPLVGGKPFGLKSTQAFLELELKTDGNGSALLGGQTGVTAGGQEINGKIGGRGKIYYSPGKGITWNGGSMLVGVEGVINKEIGLVEVIPALSGAVNLPVVGSSIAWLNNKARVTGAIGMGADLEFDLVDKDYGLDFSHSEGTLKTSLKLGLGGGEGSLKLAFEGQGEARAIFQVPASPGYLKSVEAELGASLNVTAWLFQKSFSASHTFTYPTSSASMAAASLERDDGGFRPISRDFLASHSPYNSIPQPKITPMAATNFPAWTTLIENVYPLTELTTNTNGDTAYVYFDPARETLQATEIHVLDKSRTDRVVTQDTQADMRPSMWDTVLVWMRVRNPAFPVNGELEDMAAAMEIAFTTNYLNATAPVYLTDNDYLDFDPVLVTGYSSGAALFWQSNAGNLLTGTSTSPTTVHYAPYSYNLGFPGAQEVPGSFVGAGDFQYAYSGSEYAMVWMQDKDDNPLTEADREVYARVTSGGVWGAPVRLTDNSVNERMPLVFYASDQSFHFIWEQEGAIIQSTLTSGPSEVCPERSGLAVAAMHLSSAVYIPEILIVYTDGDNFEAETINYDMTAGQWNSAIPVSIDLASTEVREFHRDYYKTLHISGIQHEESSSLVKVSPSQSNGKLSLAFPEDYTPAGPVPGQPYSIPLTVRNPNDATFTNPYIGLYSDIPTSATALLITPLASLAAGETRSISLDWTAPALVWPGPLTIAPCDAGGYPLANTDRLSLDPATCDLKPLRLQVDPGPAGSALVTVELSNEGAWPATDISVALYAYEQEISVSALSGIHPGLSAEVQFLVWPDLDFPNQVPLLSVWVDSANSVTETREDNNLMLHKIPGDDSLWAAAANLQGFKLLDWFGLFKPDASGFIYHSDHSWLFAHGHGLASFYLFDPSLQRWFWTGSDVYPFLYNFNDQEWWYFDGRFLVADLSSGID